MGFFDVIGKIFRAFKAIGRRIGLLGEALGDGIKGVWYGIGASFKSLGLGVTSLWNATKDTAKLVFKYVVCIIAFFINLPYCFLTHIITLIVYLAYYILFEIPLMIVMYATGLNLRPAANELWSIIKYGDNILYSVVGFRLTEYPPEIVNRCYKCHGKIQTTADIYNDLGEFNRIGDYVDRTFNINIPDTMRYPKSLFNSSRQKFNEVSSPI